MSRTASPLSAAVGAVIRGRYRKASMSQEKLASLTEIKIVTLQRLIAGKAEFDTDQLVSIAKALGTTVSNLLGEAEADLSRMSVAADTNDITSAEDRYLRGDYGIAAEQRTDEDEEPNDT